MGKEESVNKFLSVAAFTGGLDVPSARFRIRSLIPCLKENGVMVDEYISKSGQYPPEKKSLRPFWGIKTLLDRLPAIINTRKYDITYFQRELVSTLATLEFLSSRPRVLDVDDAIFLHKGGRTAKKLAQSCDLIICGNHFLAENFIKWNSEVTVIPTPVDCNYYCPSDAVRQYDKKVIGWIGTSSNFKYLYQIEDALAKIATEDAAVRYRIVSNDRPVFRHLKPDIVDFIKWSPENEVADIQGMSIGIMPLDDTDWERGKCSFKMLQYMACGLPVVVSPVGMNAEILSMGEVGVPAGSQQEWVDAILWLLSNPADRALLGENGRRIAVTCFNTDVISRKLSEQFFRVVSGYIS